MQPVKVFDHLSLQWLENCTKGQRNSSYKILGLGDLDFRLNINLILEISETIFSNKDQNATHFLISLLISRPTSSSVKREVRLFRLEASSFKP